MSKTLGVAGVQMEIFPGEINLANMDTQLKKIREESPWVELVLFSELAVLGKHPKYAQPIPGEIVSSLCALARKHELWLIPGSINEKCEEGFYNTALVIDPQGKIVTQYRKIYPWRPAEACISGNQFCVFDIPGKTRIGLCICYEQWFPEVSRQLMWMGAEVILCPTLTGTADRPLELILSQANAISNQLYFVNINGLGEGGNGQSIIVDPEGKILSQAEDQEQVLTAKLDLERVKQVREIGTLGVCQVLKSFRDEKTSFPLYAERLEKGEGLKNLGPLAVKPAQLIDG